MMIIEKKIWLDLPYNVRLRENLVTSLIKTLKLYLKDNVNIVVKCRASKLFVFCVTKNAIIWNQKTNVIYTIECPGWHNYYIGKTDRNLITRLSGRSSYFPNIIGLVKSLIIN